MKRRLLRWLLGGTDIYVVTDKGIPTVAYNTLQGATESTVTSDEVVTNVDLIVD